MIAMRALVLRQKVSAVLVGCCLVLGVAAMQRLDAARLPTAPSAHASLSSPSALSPAQSERGKAALLNPAAATEKAPDTFRVNFETTAGLFVVEAHRDWAPLGTDRFYNLVKLGFYDGSRFFRIVPQFIVQFGIQGDPEIQKVWREATILDEKPKQNNKRGAIAFNWQALVNARTSMLLINLVDNPALDNQEVAPFGQIVSGMEVVDKFYNYGESTPHGPGPDMFRIFSDGNSYLEKEFPKLDYIKQATLK
jgi:peptidyl-prolyl cis-trans isomerase A (cyclophilin A)